MIQLIMCGFITGLLCFWNYTYCRLSAEPAYALQNPAVLQISAVIRKIGIPVFIAFLIYTLVWSAVYYAGSLLAGLLAGAGAYKLGRGKGFIHFMGIVACVPLVLVNGMILYLIVR